MPTPEAFVAGLLLSGLAEGLDPTYGSTRLEPRDELG